MFKFIMIIMLSLGLYAQNIEKSTVQLYADKNQSVGFASGVFVKHNLILSCAHLFDVSQELLFLDSNRTFQKGKVIYLDSVNDVALIKTIDYLNNDFIEVENPDVPIDLDYVITTDNRNALFDIFSKQFGFILFQGPKNLAVKTIKENGPGQSGSPVMGLYSKKLLGIVIGVHKTQKRFLNVARIDRELFARIGLEK